MSIASVSTTPPSGTAATSMAGTSAPTGTASSNAMQDRFLKLLVAQLKNQDPMNPMDNAQMTSQLAQINTVTGIEQLNQASQAMANQFSAMQLLQGASLVGRDVLIEGDHLRVQDGVAEGQFDLPNAAGVRVEVLGPSGQVVASKDLGTVAAGRQRFEWDASGLPPGTELHYRVVSRDSASDPRATLMTPERVTSVALDGNSLSLRLVSGRTTTASGVRAVL